MIVGVSGGEYGVRGHVTAYDIATGRMVWRAHSTGPDADMLIDPERTTLLGKPVGKDSSLTSWNDEQWKTGGGTAWGWFSYDPDANLIYYGTGNPAPVERRAAYWRGRQALGQQVDGRDFRAQPRQPGSTR